LGDQRQRGLSALGEPLHRCREHCAPAPTGTF
jgi:hypothetical protein